MRNGKREMQGITKFAIAGWAVFGCMVGISALIESGEATPSVQEDVRQPFFPVATSPSVAKCVEAALVFDTNRTVQQARVIELTCQAEMNSPGLSDACDEYASAVWVASGKFQRAMEADAGRGRIFQADMESHKARARAAAPNCV